VKPKDLDGGNEKPSLPLERPWFLKNRAPTALTLAGVEYLRHIFSKEQLALYRVVTRDANRFPELGRGYRQEVVENGIAIFTHVLQTRDPTERALRRRTTRLA
jgi:hypothetical protein